MVCVDAFSGDILLRMVHCFVCVTQTCEKNKQMFRNISYQVCIMKTVGYFTLKNAETYFIHFEKAMLNI